MIPPPWTLSPPWPATGLHPLVISSSGKKLKQKKKNKIGKVREKKVKNRKRKKISRVAFLSNKKKFSIFIQPKNVSGQTNDQNH